MCGRKAQAFAPRRELFQESIATLDGQRSELVRFLLPFISTLGDEPERFRVAGAGLVPRLRRYQQMGAAIPVGSGLSDDRDACERQPLTDATTRMWCLLPIWNDAWSSGRESQNETKNRVRIERTSGLT